jgi:hypothetical protein
MTAQRTVYAESVNYWKTGTSSPDTWIDKAKEEIRAVGGLVTGTAAMDTEGGGAAFALLFTLAGDSYRVNWPVLPIDPRKRRTPAQLKADERAAKIQAATFLHHDVKAKCMVVKVMGASAAFLQYRLMPSGTTPAELGFRGEQVIVPPSMLLLGGGE